MHLEVDGAYRVRCEEHVVPVGPTVAAPVDAPVRIRPKGVSEGRNVYQVRIPGVNQQRADLPRVVEPDVAPGLPNVIGPIHTSPGDDVTPNAVRSCAHIDHSRIGGGYANGTDRAGSEVPVRHVYPALAVVGGLPDSPARGPHVEGPLRSGMPRNGRRPPASRWPDHPVVQAGKYRRIVYLISIGR